MPIYEFLCAGCNRIYSFHSFKVDPEKVPACPKCAATDLVRVPSRFGIGPRGIAGGERTGEGPDLDDPRVGEKFRQVASQGGRLGSRGSTKIDQDDAESGCCSMDIIGLAVIASFQSVLLRWQE
jgi:putative FmdB family regulatory protein